MISDLQDRENEILNLMVDDLTKRIDVDLTTLVEENSMLSWDDIEKLKTVGISSSGLILSIIRGCWGFRGHPAKSVFSRGICWPA